MVLFYFDGLHKNESNSSNQTQHREEVSRLGQSKVGREESGLPVELA